MIDLSTAARSTRARLIKAALCLCTIVFLLGLTASFSHTHDLADELPDCVSCHVGSQGQAALTGASCALLAIFLVVLYLAARRPRYVNIVPLRYLIPSRQAPPARMP